MGPITMQHISNHSMMLPRKLTLGFFVKITFSFISGLI